jgi:putative MFS transporter
MAISVNAGGRLDRLPISSFHHRIFWLIGAGMLLDGYELYVFTNVLRPPPRGVLDLAAKRGFHLENLLGMTIGALVTGFW